MATVALAGNPNSGKTTLFNRLTGLRQRVGNYPGVTVERRSGPAKLPGRTVELIDLPGTYSLVPQSREEAIAFEVLAGLFGPAPDAVVVVVDATNVLRNLYLALSVLELGRPVVVALTMVDLAREAGLRVDAERLAADLGAPVVPVVARTGEGLEALGAAVEAALDRAPPPPRLAPLPEELEAVVARVAEALPEDGSPMGPGVARWLIAAEGLALGAGTESPAPPALAAAASRARRAAVGRPFAPTELIEARYRVARALDEGAVHRPPETAATPTDRLDSVLLHPVKGVAVFAAVMAVLFQSVFAWAEPLMALIEGGVGFARDGVKAHLPEGALTDLLADGVIGGVGNVVVFLPQIAFLFAFIAVLEDSGYLARAAFISDRMMAKAGLHGRAFVPLLSGFACAVPAILASRTIESPKDRLVTILVTPLVSCSARLPVYSVILAALFSSSEPVFGVLSVGGLLLFAMYLASIAVTVGAAAVLKRTVLKSPTPPLVLELPPYRRPALASVFGRAFDRSRVFVRDAGSVILVCSMALWALLYFPSHVPESFEYESRIMQVGEDTEARMLLEQEAQAARVQASFGGRIGHALEPVFAPLGYDWKMVIAILASFAAREVFVSTLGLVYGIGEDVDEESVPLRERLQSEVDPCTGRKVYTPLVGLSLMVFFLLALQCMSTLAAIRRETRSWRWPAFAFAYNGALAWLAAFAVYQGGRLFGWS